MSVSVHLPQFEGPLALLIYLIRKEEMDIFNININEITAEYLAYIRRMKSLDLETAGDFVAMAATLIQIKSQMLLPQYVDEGEEEPLDPRKELVQKLLDYERFQKASKDLYAIPLLNRDLWTRGGKESLPVDKGEDEIILDEGGLFPLIGMYRSALRRVKKNVHKVSLKRKSIAGRITEIKDRLIVGQRMAMSELMRDANEFRPELLITFLSSLELGKMGFLSLFQGETYGEIYLTARRSIDEAHIDQVEEYQSQFNGDLDEQQPTTPSSFVVEETEVDEEIATDEDIEMAEKELEAQS